MRWTFHIIFVILFLPFGNEVWADSTELTEIRKFDEEKYDELVNDADYFSQKKEEKDRRRRRSGQMGEISIGPLKYVLLGAVILLIVFLLLRVFASELFVRNRKLDKRFPISMEDLEEHVEDAPMNQFLIDCLNKGDYTNAIRIYYLMVLQKLNKNGLIRWHKQKTNSHYLWEMRLHQHYPLFLSLTGVFERVWYGEHYQMDQIGFTTVEPEFKQMLELLENRGTDRSTNRSMIKA